MKLGYVLSASLIASCAVGIALPNSTPSLDAIFQDHFINLTDAFDTSALAESRVRAAATDQEQWAANVARGKKLLAAMKSTDLEAATLFKLGRAGLTGTSKPRCASGVGMTIQMR